MTKEINWSAIEQDYRAGVKTLRAMAAEHDITHAAIRKRAKRDGWVQDLSARIRAKMLDKVSRAAVSKSVSAKRAATDTEVVDANSTLMTGVLLSHRGDLRSTREISTSMIAELGAKRCTPEEAKALAMTVVQIKKITDPLEQIRVVDAIMKSLDLGHRSGILKNLATSLTTLIDAERTAFNIDDRTRGANEIVEGLKRLAAMPVD